MTEILEKTEKKTQTTEENIRQPSNWGLMFYDDDTTPAGFVAVIIMKVLHFSEQESLSFTLKIQNEGKLLIGSFPKSIANGKKEKIDIMAGNYGYPLKVEVEEINEE